MYRADLHIHSRFSRATSSRLTVPHLAAWAGVKGISVLGTGDFTHPVWRDELRRDLVPDEATGLYKLAAPLTREDRIREIPGLEDLPLGEPRFMLQAEISSIYKKNGAVRKVHSLVYMPDFESADRLSHKLEQVGNLASDGRPILGLDVKHLLEMVLEIPRARFIPAHIWTPWFSLFGSKSGFDSLEECFDDLSPYIFAVETGLSSDPDMNRCWSHLDRLAMVSNSDAHSGENLGREATQFSGQPSYEGIFQALEKHETSPGYGGTLEFFPEEGKYHQDGHRDCGVCLEPAECRKLDNICPVCGKPLTVGVLHRVTALADRAEPPKPGAGFLSLIPLAEVLGELVHCGPKSKKVRAKTEEVCRRFGPELDVLLESPLDDVRRYWPELGEALGRMRDGRVIRQPGFDGQYGVIRLFEPGEMQPSLLDRVPRPRKKPLSRKKLEPLRGEQDTQAVSATSSLVYTPAQLAALHAGPEPILVLAGPGSGKTRTLMGRMESLLKNGIPAGDIVAITFTRRAAGELHERMAASLPDTPVLPEADTLHALALRCWPDAVPLVLNEESSRRAFAQANPELDSRNVSQLFGRLSLAREQNQIPPELVPTAQAYATWKKRHGRADYTDLLEVWLNELEKAVSKPWKHVLVDEVQDLSPLQTALIRALLPEDGTGFFGIGDPDQSVYGFRGAEGDIEGVLRAMWPDLHVLSLDQSHRAPAAVLEAGRAVLGDQAVCSGLKAVGARSATLQYLAAPTPQQEAAWVAERIAWLIGGTSHSSADQQRDMAGTHLNGGSCSPGDIAVLVRLKALMTPLRLALEKQGIPVAVPESEAFWQDPLVERFLSGAAALIHGQAGKADPAFTALGEDIWAAGPKTVREHAERQGAVEFDMLFANSKVFSSLERVFNEMERDWGKLLEHVALLQELDLVRSRSEKVQLMTMHAAKGLEFRVIFLPCLEDGLMPFRGMDALLRPEGPPLDSCTDGRDEERCLLYVGLTRASEAVFASSSDNRSLFGHRFSLPPCPFLPIDVFFQVELKKRTRRTASQLSLF